MFAQKRELTKLTDNDNLNVDIKHICLGGEGFLSNSK